MTDYAPFEFAITLHAVNRDVARNILREELSEISQLTTDIQPLDQRNSDLVDQLNHQRGRVVDLESQVHRLQQQAAAREEEVRQTIIDYIGHAFEVEEGNDILERLGLEPVVHKVRSTIKLSVDVLVDVTNNEDTTLQQVTERLKRVLSFDPTVSMQLAGNELELSEVEAVYVSEVGSVQQAV